MIAALVPVKRLDTAKSRLRARLDGEALAHLTLAMLGDVLAALAGAAGLGAVAVVTEDERVAAAAREAGARALVRADAGLNASLDAASAELVACGMRDLLVVLGDVPGIASSDVATLLAAGDALGPRAVVLAPSRDGGTAALFRRPHDVIASAFGPDSAARHRALAREASVPLRELALPGLAVDLDRPEDVALFLAGPGPAPRTRALLRTAPEPA